MRLKFNALIISISIISSVKASMTSDLKLDTQLSVDFRSYYFDGNKSNLNLDIFSYSDDYSQIMVKLHEKIKLEKLSLPIKLRINEKYSFLNKKNYTELIVDEFLVDYSITDTFIFNLGRKQLNNGFSLGYNPTNYINKNKYQDRHLSDNDRRSEIEGSDLIGFLYYLNSSSIELYYLSKQQHFYIAYNDNFPQINTNIGLSYFYDNYSSIGLNISTTLSDKITGYLEESISKKRDRLTLNNSSLSNSIELNKDGFYNDLVIGAQYTANNAVNFNLEYWYNQNGYSKKEYMNLRNYIYSDQSTISEKNVFSKLSNIFRNKLFFRVSDIPIVDPILIDTMLIYSLNDESIFYLASINYAFSENTAIRLDGNIFRGTQYSEYGQIPINCGLYLSISYLF